MKKSLFIITNIIIIAALTGTVLYLYYARTHFDWLGVNNINYISDIPQNIELLYALPFLITLAVVDIIAFIMIKRGTDIKHKFIFMLNVLIVTSMIVTVSISYYLLEYSLNSSAPGYVAIHINAPPFLLALIVVNVVRFVIDTRRNKHTPSYKTK